MQKPSSTIIICSAGVIAGTVVGVVAYQYVQRAKNTYSITSLSALHALTGNGPIPAMLRKTLYTQVTDIRVQDASLDELIGLETLPNLVSINFSGSLASLTLPRIVLITSLTHLNLSKTKISKIPEAIGNLTELIDLDLSKNLIKDVPASIGKLKKLKYLNLMGNQIEQLPEKICELSALYRLGLKSNKLSKLPEGIGKLTALVELFITGNMLETLPESMGQLVNLVKLQASFNELKSLPDSMGGLQHLEMCRVAVNKLPYIPLEFNKLRYLAWFSLAGNETVGQAPPPRSDIVQLKIQDIDLQQSLGDGASGDVYMGIWNQKEVAVKLFKSDTSPDGQASDEISLACALNHPNLVKVIAQVIDQNGKCTALVTQLYKGIPLAAKPNFENLLRCRWAEDAQFEVKFIVKVSKQIADALQYLHSLGIAHGDVYAHNVLVDTDDTAILCDLGAGFAYQLNESAILWEAMEVRAFGLMLKDMLNRVTQDSNTESIEQLQSLVHVCTESQVLDRPNFNYVNNLLHAIEQVD
eukprot:TRINITY_DN231_c0_g1_i14.p1 TRINITY_DN231_c0_g1~~TRINITY_DN231_c0_g1_i14.p1  ORF type:complete len:527 (-),score=51.99 TRINITY_DN231_c0_g1_i14:194-1774(-)